jgi:hypothetical protein
MTLRKMAEVVMLLTYIQELTSSNLGQDTHYPEVSVVFLNPSQQILV